MTPIRTRPVAAVLVFAAAVVLVACASSSGAKTPKKMQVRTHVDPQAQFSSYRTYGFVPMPGTNIEGKTTALTIHFMRAVRHEMDARGYSYTEDSPDLWVNFNANPRATGDTQTNVTPAHGYSSYYGYRGDLYGIPVLMEHDQEETVTYRVGTGNVDVVDARKKMLIWVGIAEGRITEEMIADPGPALARIVADMFDHYPAKAAK
jgi:hypothetical protein